MKIGYARVVAALVFWGAIFYLLRKSFQSFPTLAELTTAISGNADPGLLALGCGLFFCSMLVRASRFYFLMNSIVPLAKGDTVAMFFWSFFLGAISPFRAGESVRLLWARQQGVDMVSTAAVWFAERSADLYVIATLSLCSAMLVFGYLQSGWSVALGVGLLALPLLLVSYLLRHPDGMRMPLLQRLPPALGARLHFMQSYRFLFGFAFLTLSIWLLMWLMFYVAYSAFVAGLSPVGAALLLGLVNLSFLVAFLPGNLVGYQTAAVFALGLLGVTTTIALAASIVVHVLTFVIVIALGVLARAWLAVSRSTKIRHSVAPARQGK